MKRQEKRELLALEREFLAPLLEIQESPPSPAQHWVLWTIVLLVASLIVWACIGKVSVVATAPGKFIPDGRVKQLQPLETSIVKAIHVREGQHVKEGELLLELDPTISAAEVQANTDKYGFNRLEQSRLTAELNHSPLQVHDHGQPAERVALEERMQRARELAYRSKLANAEATVEEKTHALAAAEATLEKYRATTAIASEKEANARPLVETGAVSKVDYLQLKEDFAQNENDLAAQEKSVLQARAAQTEAEISVERIRHEHAADIYNDLDERVANEPALKGDLDKSKELYALKWVRSPVAGVVQKVSVTTMGEVVTPAQPLVTIVPDGTPLIVEATVTNQDIGYVRSGQPAEIKVDTFPFQRYGSINGVLTWVSADAEDKPEATDQELRAGSRRDSAAERREQEKLSAGYVYKVHVAPRRTTLDVDGSVRSIQAGMTVQADIVTDRRTVMDFLLSPVVRSASEGLRVR